jgi:hypothetical protein
VNRVGPPRTSRLLPLVVAGLSFAYLLTYPVAIGGADESQILYGAKRILQGQAIYKDFFEVLTPLSYYLFAGVFRIAGTTLLAARLVMALIEAAGCAALFQLVRRTSSIVEAILATLIFVGICIPTWPYVSPHWISTVLSLLVATATLADRWQQSARLRPLIAGMLAGGAICVQQQRGVFVALWLPLALCVLGRAYPRATRWRRLGSELAWAASGGAMVVLAVLGAAAWASSVSTVVDAIFASVLKHYGTTYSGREPWAAVLILTAFLLAPTWLWLLRIAPLFVVVEGVFLLRDLRQSGERPELERACLLLLAVLMGLSIWYLHDFIHVSFVLPFFLIPGATLLYRFRSASLWAHVPAGRRAVTVGVWLVVLAVAGQCAVNVAHAYTMVPMRIETAFGVLRLNQRMASLFEALHGHLVREPDGTSRLYSYPDDAWLYLALPADNATRFSNLFPSFPADSIQETLDALRARRAGTVVLATGPFSFKPITKAVEEGYDAVEDVESYRIYTRRGTDGQPTSGPIE